MAEHRGPQSRTGKHIGWTLLIALVFAVSVAISLAVQLGDDVTSPPPPSCGGLFEECCDDWPYGDDREDDFDRRDDGRRGLFDAEEDFTDRPRRSAC